MRDETFLRRLGVVGLLGLSCCVVPGGAAAAGFTAGANGAPEGWTCGSTGGGSPRWSVEAEPTSGASGPVLKQSGRGKFPWCVKNDASLADGWVQVRFKPVAGREDQAGGVVWRWQDGDHYYVARANALENNVSLYITEGGTRRTIRYRDAPVAGNAWHVLRVEFKGTQIRVLLDGKAYIEETDARLGRAGRVGVWTKADSVTLFDDFSYGTQ
jgi:hypothetical protein